MRSFTHMILDWTEEKLDELMVDPDNSKHPYAKAFALGAVEGLLDGMVIAGGVFLVAAGVGFELKKRSK